MASVETRRLPIEGSESSAEAERSNAFRRWCAEEGFSLPLPGDGRTSARFDRLRELGRDDLSFARLGEGHADAVAILAEAGRSAPLDASLAVWAAGPIADVRARKTGSGWCLSGIRRWCSGASIVTHALVTALADDGERLFLVPMCARGIDVDPSTWAAVGMEGSGSYDVAFNDVDLAGIADVGDPGYYLSRLGFWIGAIGVAAVWLGGSEAVLETLASDARDPHALAHLGAVYGRLTLLGEALARAGTRVDELLAHRSGTSSDEDRRVDLELLARSLRAEIEAGATETLGRAGRAQGAEPLCRDAAHARRVADLTVFLRQSHGERDLEALGALALRAGKLLPSRERR